MKKKVMEKTLVVVLIVLIAFILYYLLLFKPTCATEECFKQALAKCKPSQINKVTNGNIYNYEIQRSLGNACTMEVTFTKASVGTNVELVELLEGKSMKCKIPKEEISTLNINQLDSVIKYCTGPLKEGLYELIIKRMFTNIVAQMSTILDKVGDII